MMSLQTLIFKIHNRKGKNSGGEMFLKDKNVPPAIKRNFWDFSNAADHLNNDKHIFSLVNIY